MNRANLPHHLDRPHNWASSPEMSARCVSQVSAFSQLMYDARNSKFVIILMWLDLVPIKCEKHRRWLDLLGGICAIYIISNCMCITGVTHIHRNPTLYNITRSCHCFGFVVTSARVASQSVGEAVR